jgi:hypothetical protein
VPWAGVETEGVSRYFSLFMVVKWVPVGRWASVDFGVSGKWEISGWSYYLSTSCPDRGRNGMEPSI